jgi:hypothetical protein
MVRMTMRCKRGYFSVDDLKRLHLWFKKSYHSSLHRDEDAKFIKHQGDRRTHYLGRSAYPSARTARALWSPIQYYRSVRLMRRFPTPHRVWLSCTHQTNTETCKETTELIILPQGLPVQRFKFSLTVGMYRVVSLSLYDALQTTVIIRRINDCGTNRSTDRIIHPHGCPVQGRKLSEKLLI